MLKRCHDPFNSDRLLYGTGLTLYGSTDLTKWDTAGGQITIKPAAAGLEETAVNDLISPPSGASLISGLGDIGGFTHTDLTKAPGATTGLAGFTTTNDLDYAEKSPGTVVRTGTFSRSATYRTNDKFLQFSTDGGNNWFQAQEPAGSTGGGTVAAAADGSRFVYSPAGAVVSYSIGFGTTWTASTGIPTGAAVEADRVNPMKFYGFSNGTFYVSTDGGVSFTATAATGLPNPGRQHAMPGVEGDVWLTGSTGLFHSTNSGASFTKVAGITGFAPVPRGPKAQHSATFIDRMGIAAASKNKGPAWLTLTSAAILS